MKHSTLITLLCIAAPALSFDMNYNRHPARDLAHELVERDVLSLELASRDFYSFLEARDLEEEFESFTRRAVLPGKLTFIFDSSFSGRSKGFKDHIEAVVKRKTGGASPGTTVKCDLSISQPTVRYKCTNGKEGKFWTSKTSADF